MGTRREHCFYVEVVVASSLFFFPFSPLLFINHTKRSASRPAHPVTIRIVQVAGTTRCLMDINSLLALLGPVSPTLAAYHYLKSPTDYPASRCSRCGHALIPAISHSRIVPSSQRGKKARPSPNTPIIHCLRQSCAICGHVNNTLLSDFHNVAPSRPYPVAVTVTPRTSGTDQCPPADPSPSNQPQPPMKSRRSRPKHRAGLQEMLARNKERQHEAINRGTSGLTTFLHGGL